MSRRSSLSLAALRGAALPGTAWSMAARLSAAWSLALAFACGSAGPHGYSRVYSPLDEEAEAARGAERYDPVMAHRLPEQWKDKKLELFGVVIGRAEARDGLTDLTLSVRRLAARNLCSAGEEDTCRVTVGDQELARVHALVALREGDAVGQKNVKPQALVRVVGKLEDHVDKTDGADVIVASYYRHWPAAEYVTEQARSYMRR